MIDAPARTAAPRPQRSRLWRKIARRPVGIAAFVLLLLILLAVTFGPALVPHSPTRANALNILQPPSATNLLGTDELGRDVLARLLSGGRVSLAVGLFSMLVGLSIGVAIGGTAGYFGGTVESALMRVVDTFMAIPTFFLILVIVTSFGNHPITIIVTVGLGFWAQMARVAHAEFKRFRNHDFVEASKALGGSHLRVMARHILPQVMPQATVLATLGVGWAILTEAALSYLGLGIQPPLASWGNMLQNAQGYLWRAPVLAVWPGLFIAVTVLSFNLLGNALRDVLDPRA
ncbi:MAG: ABC transporter permease [Trueperaceae bacterium]